MRYRPEYGPTIPVPPIISFSYTSSSISLTISYRAHKNATRTVLFTLNIYMFVCNHVLSCIIRALDAKTVFIIMEHNQNTNGCRFLSLSSHFYRLLHRFSVHNSSSNTFIICSCRLRACTERVLLGKNNMC